MSTGKLTGKTFTYPASCILLSFSKKHHDYFFRRVFESVRAQFVSGNVSGLLVIYMLNYDSSMSTFSILDVS